MRIWYQSMTQVKTLTHYSAALNQHAKRVCSEGVEVVFNGVTEQRYHGRMPAEILRYSYAKLVLQTEVIEFCRQAEREKFDAVILGSFSEPYLQEIRSLLNIPVVSMPECALLVACSMAEQFALITLAPANVRRLKALVRRHGLDSRISGYHALENHVDEADLNTALTRPAQVIADFTAAARMAVAAGADLVVPAEGILNLVLHGNGVNTIEGATVQDCVGVAFLYAELLVNLKRRVGLGPGRRWAYAMPPPDLLAQLDSQR
jgi:Asp/Glu/hydantoin racemase